MGKLIGVVVLVGGFLIWRRWRKLPTSQAKRKFSFQAIVSGLLVVIVLLAISGRIHPLGAVFAALVPLVKVGLNLLIRYFPLFAQLYGANYAKPRTLNTEDISVEINFATGAVTGKVLQGKYADKSLEELSESEISELLSYCQGRSKKSAYLLQLYIAQRFRRADGTQQSSQSNSANNGSLSKEEAAEILGVGADADKTEVTKAHRLLIGKVHPDKGGNDYLASLLNRARDRLIDE